MMKREGHDTFDSYQYEPGDEVDIVPDDERKPHRFVLTPFSALRPNGTRAYLVKGLIPRVGLVVVWGPPKCGKSFWTFDLVMHPALGWEYRGRKVQQGTIVYCAFEGADGFNKRGEAFKRKHSVTDAPLYLVSARMSMVKDHAELIADIREQLPADELPVAVVLDTLNRSLAGSESNDQDMGDYIKAADAIREAFGCAVIIVHHCGVEGSRPRGHTSLTGAVDAQLAVKRDPNGTITVNVEYMKDDAEGDEITSRLETIEVGADVDGDPMTSCVVVPAEAGIAKDATIKPTGQAGIALEALYEALAECGEMVPSSHIPPQTRTTTVVRWTSYFEAKTIGDRTKPDSKRKSFVRASDKLQALKIIGVWNDRVWVSGQAGQARTSVIFQRDRSPDRHASPPTGEAVVRTVQTADSGVRAEKVNIDRRRVRETGTQADGLPPDAEVLGSAGPGERCFRCGKGSGVKLIRRRKGEPADQMHIACAAERWTAEPIKGGQ